MKTETRKAHGIDDSGWLERAAKAKPPEQKKRKLLPLADRIIVKRASGGDVLIGDLVVIKSETDVPNEGTVLAVGEGRHEDGRLAPLAVHEGDCVLFGKYAGIEMNVDGETFLVMREEEVMAIFR